MTASHARALSKRAGALLGAIAILITGCMAGASSSPQSGRAQAAHAAAASSSSNSLAHRTAGISEPRGVGHGSGPGIAGAPPLSQCALAAGHPVMYRAGPASRAPVAGPVCLCCPWCACAWVCCGCGPGGRPPGWWPPRSHLAWRCCSHRPWPPGWGSSPILPACGPGCLSRACPTWRQAPAPGLPEPPRVRSWSAPPGGTTAAHELTGSTRDRQAGEAKMTSQRRPARRPACAGGPPCW